MSSELEIYKQSQINRLNVLFNASLVSLRNNLDTQIKKINKQNISKTIKIILLTNLKNIYNKNVAKLTKEYNNNKNKILLLTEIPITKNALLIGINYIGTSNELYGCINDTNNIKNLLQQKYNYNNFNILTDNTNKKPTKQNILSELTNLLVNSNLGDCLFFLYSGHGTCTIDLNNDETDGQDEMIVPLDANNVETCISDDELNQIIKNNLKEGVKLFMLFDSCFSGTVLDLKYNYFDTNNNTTVNPNVSDTLGQVIMISGCMDSQTSSEAYVNYGGKNISAGAMTFSFLKTIEQFGTNISIKKLIDSMRTLLKDNSYEQIPQLSSGKFIDVNTLLPL